MPDFHWVSIPYLYNTRLISPLSYDIYFISDLLHRRHGCHFASYFIIGFTLIQKRPAYMFLRFLTILPLDATTLRCTRLQYRYMISWPTIPCLHFRHHHTARGAPTRYRSSLHVGRNSPSADAQRLFARDVAQGHSSSQRRRYAGPTRRAGADADAMPSRHRQPAKTSSRFYTMNTRAKEAEARICLRSAVICYRLAPQSPALRICACMATQIGYRQHAAAKLHTSAP